MQIITQTEVLYSLEDVWKTYVVGGSLVHALRGVNLRVIKGEFLSIMGPSGSGKSTLLMILGLLTSPTRGKVEFLSRDISSLSDREATEMRRRTIGFVFQTYNLIPWLTAAENVEIAMAIAGYPQSVRKERVKELLESVGLEHRMKHKPLELSGGEQQRVAIARALANDPAVILADEPTGNLSTEQGEEIVELLRSLKEKGKTIVMVTHNPAMAEKADRIVRIRDGVIEEGYV
ncbi:MAG: ABC transporter ATP-binding protein [Candidatus Methanodesulfokora sp.]|jgi:putative ABC transport system ATP-binding protein|nr:MAG: ABC transporter ATP-binding protein [Candidatus Korarchaeota archaeon]